MQLSRPNTRNTIWRTKTRRVKEFLNVWYVMAPLLGTLDVPIVEGQDNGEDIEPGDICKQRQVDQM